MWSKTCFLPGTQLENWADSTHQNGGQRGGGGWRGRLDRMDPASHDRPNNPLASWKLLGTQIKGRGWKERMGAWEEKMKE